MNQGRLSLAFATPALAKEAAAALAPDDAAALSHRIEGSHLILEAAGDSFLGLLRTLDDALTCLRVLEGADPESVSQMRRDDG